MDGRVAHWLRRVRFVPQGEARHLVALFAFALCIRLIGINWGGVHPDENVGASVKVLSGRVIPDYHYYPPLLSYLNALVQLAMFVGGLLTGAWNGTAAFRAHYFDDPTPFIVANRMVTVVAASACAPLASMIARRLGVRSWLGLAVGVLVAILPLSVLLSHFSKPDTGMAAGLMVTAYTYLRVVEQPTRARGLVWFGVASAFAVSFKHSAIFLILPLVLLYQVRLFRALGAGSVKAQLRLSILWGAAFVLTWVPLNVGVWLDLRNFLAFQRVQSLMSVRESGFGTLVGVLIPRLADALSIPLLVTWVVSLFWQRSFAYLSLWFAVTLNLVTVGMMVGERAKPSLFIAHATLITALGGAALANLIENAKSRWFKLASAAVFGATALGFLVKSIEVKRQAVRPSKQRELVTRAVLSVAKPGQTRVLDDSGLVDYPIDPQAARDVLARHERLARKYRVVLPPRAKERDRKPKVDARTPLYVRPMPFTVGGLEIYEEGQVKEVKPFAWPPQPEEYSLRYWLDQGFSVFVVSQEEVFSRSTSRFYRQRVREIRDGGELIASVPAERPLFLEYDIKVYRAREQPAGGS